MSAPTCPECGAVVQLEEQVTINEPYLPPFIVRGEELPRRERVARAVGFCTGCEFVIEVKVWIEVKV